MNVDLEQIFTAYKLGKLMGSKKWEFTVHFFFMFKNRAYGVESQIIWSALIENHSDKQYIQWR